MWYYTAPGLAWDAALKLTEVELELISDMYLFIEKGIRGGISTITKRYAKANNKYIGLSKVPESVIQCLKKLDVTIQKDPKDLEGKLEVLEAEVGDIMNDHDDEDVEFVNQYLSKNLTKWVKGINRKGEYQSIYIPYMDANNLYGWAMSQPLSIRDFEWMDDKELEEWRNHGCILEVDLEYPEKLHDKHNEYPLAPERIKVNKVEKLIPNLNDKEKYVVHHKTLKLYLDL